MKRKTKRADEGEELKEAAVPYAVEASMVRTQIYLTRQEHEFLQLESGRRGEPMAAVIRAYIDERMNVPEDAWNNNPLLDATPSDPAWEGHEDGALNHDHYVYGSPKRFEKRGDRWVPLPPVS